MADELPIMEEAKKLMDKGELPNEVTLSILWAGLNHVYAQAARTNGRVTRLEFAFIALTSITVANAGNIIEWIIKLF